MFRQTNTRAITPASSLELVIQQYNALSIECTYASFEYLSTDACDSNVQSCTDLLRGLKAEKRIANEANIPEINRMLINVYSWRGDMNKRLNDVNYIFDYQEVCILDPRNEMALKEIQLYRKPEQICCRIS